MAFKISASRMDAENGRIDNAVFKDYGETTTGGASGTNTGGAYTVDLSTANTFNLILNANCTFTFSNPLSSGTTNGFQIILKQDIEGSRTVTWPAAVKWPGGTAPTLATTAFGVDTFSFLTLDAGTRYFGFPASSFSAIYPPISLWSFGRNDIDGGGQLGLGDASAARSSPTQVGTLTTWAHAAVSYHSLAVKTDGTLWSWGENSQGQLGLSGIAPASDRSSPTQVGALTTWSSAISVSRFQSLAIKTDGTLWSWGNNSYGQLGHGLTGTADRSSPTQVGTLTTWARVSAGAYHSLAIRTNGTLWSWGFNQNGQLGHGSGTYRSSPTQVGALTTWSKVAVGFDHSLALKTDGTLWAFGDNNSGELGIGTTVAANSPTQVGSLTTWSKVAAGGNHSLAIKTDGTLWSWGGGSSGQLGNGLALARSSPVQVGTLTTWGKIAGVGSHSLAIKTDGTLWSWGENSSGALGLGDGASEGSVERSSPCQVGTLTTWQMVAGGSSSQHSMALRS